jgi:parallel beta-helix repeat protein
MGLNIPYTKRAADSIRSKASRSVLSSVRVPILKKQNIQTVKPRTTGYIAGAGATALPNIPANAIIVNPGDSIQLALQTAAGTGKWIILKAGTHTFKSTLKIPGNITICGEGINTVLFLDPASGMRETMINAEDDLHDVTIRDLVIECAAKTDPGTDPNSNRSYRGGYNRGGILFRSPGNVQMKNINLINLTIQNATYNGAFITGAEGVTVSRCNFSENGVSVAPGQKLLHNLLLTHCSKVIVSDSRSVTSPNGSGIALDHCSDVQVSNCEIARNGWYGISIAESKNISVKNSLIEANDRSGVIVEFQQNSCENITIDNNLIQYNNGPGAETYATKNSKVENNKYAGNGNNTAQEKISTEKYILME